MSGHNPPASATTDGLPQGLAALSTLPSEEGRAAWEQMVLPAGRKEWLLNWAVLAMEHGHSLPAAEGGLQRLLVLAGPPGTGKSMTARGLASAAAQACGGDAVLAEIDAHALPSDMLGQSQRNVVRLLSQTVPDLAGAHGRVVVLADEIEAFAMRRSAASLDTNPADLHRATDAVLAGLDTLARCWPNVLFLTTTNYEAAVDEALLSRADWVVEFERPDEAAAAAIIRGSLERLAARWPEVGALARDAALAATLAQACKGADGRAVAKLAPLALSLRQEVARDPARLAADDLLAAAGRVGGEQVSAGWAQDAPWRTPSGTGES